MKALVTACALVLAGCAANPYLPSMVTAESARGMTEEQLCVTWYNADHSRSHPAYAELMRRETITPAEADTASNRRVSMGMSDIAVWCAWGAPSTINRSNYGRGEEKQYVYRRGYSAQYVYIRAGVVTAWN